MKQDQDWEMLTQVYGQPCAIKILLPIDNVGKVLRLVGKKPILCLPPRKVLKCRECGNIDVLRAGVECTVGARVVVLREVDGEVQVDQGEPLSEANDSTGPEAFGCDDSQ